MNKLSKDQQKKLEDIRQRWTTARDALDVAQADANEKIAQVQSDLSDKIADLNALVEEANGIREEIEADAQSYYDEKSEKWQEGDRGSAYSEWISAWQNEVEEIEEVALDTIARVEDVPESLLSEDDYPSEPST